MKKSIYLFCTCIFLIASCNTRKTASQKILTGSNLQSRFIQLKAGTSYTLKTPGGAVVKIPGNAFTAEPGTEIQLELKEAYTLQDILMAGLVTESNGKPLRSAGMIYINATTGGLPAALAKPIKVSIPTDVFDDRMQLYRGEINADSIVNWIEPQPLDTNQFTQRLLKGRKLFLANCASCHKPTQDFTGPALAKCRERAPDKDWPYRFITNTVVMVESDPYARKLMNKYKSVMTAFPQLGKDNIEAILDYCDNEAALNPISLPVLKDSQTVTVPCGTDTVYYAKPDTAIKIIPEDDSLNDADYIPDEIIQTKKEEYNEPLRSGFTDPNRTSGMYDFEIKTLGWYNIDAFAEGYKGSRLVTVEADLKMTDAADMHVYLFCADKKMLSVGYDKNGNRYSFNKIGNKIPLFMNDRTVLLAFGSKGEKMYYGTATFFVKETQLIPIKIKETTEEELKSFIRSNNIDGIEIDTKKKEDYKIIERPCNGLYPDSAVNTK